MFKNNTSGKSEIQFDTNSIDRIAEGTHLEGKLQSSKGMRIDGTVIGSIVCEGKVVIGPKGLVEGDLDCTQADIEGTIKGNVKVKDLLELKASAILEGEIFTGKLAIEPGATFTGNCSMGGVLKGMNKPENKNQKNLVVEKTA
jgi:cytoskeletal protein CcmA (bactofilin family)